MDENLVGYLLQSLDPETQAQVEDYLHTHPEASARLERLRHTLEPLAADSEEASVPPGLWVRTLAHIAHDRCRKPKTLPFSGSYRDLPAAPRPSWSQWLGSGASWVRRADVLVAAVLLLAVTGLGVTWLAGVTTRNKQMLACQNNLRQFYQSLHAYSDHHDNQFPLVEAKPPRNVAGIFVPILHDAGFLSPTTSVSCASPTVPVRSPSLEELEELRRERPDEFDSLVHDLAGCYAYSLGYGTPYAHSGLRSDIGEHLPLMADRPAYRDGRVAAGNSPNHGGNGQNVLFVDGSVEFATQRTVGVNRDDIYVNQRGEVAAGRNLFDSVLGASWVRPYPRDE